MRPTSKVALPAQQVSEVKALAEDPARLFLKARSVSRADPATTAHLGWTLNADYGIGVLILGVLSTTAWAKPTAHGATATPRAKAPSARTFSGRRRSGELGSQDDPFGRNGF